MAPLFDIKNKKDRLKQRFDTFRKELRSDPSKKIKDVVTKNSSVIDLSHVKQRSAESARGRAFADAIPPAAVVKKVQKRETPHRSEQAAVRSMSGLAFEEKPGREKKRIIAVGFVSGFLSRPLVWWGVFGGILTVTFLLFTFVFDRATVVIIPREEKISLQGVSIGADTSLHALDVATKRLPALRIEVIKSAHDSFPTSGKKYVQSRAEGVVTIANSYSAKSQQLVRNTRFVEQGGKIFRLMRTVTVPGASMKDGKLIPSSVDAEVIADQPGSDYNISPTNFKIPGFAGTPKYDTFLAVSQKAFGGGYVGEARFATDNDIRSASEQVTKEVYDAIKTELAGKIPSGFVALDGSRLITITDVKKPLGLMIGDSFDFSANGSGFIILYKQTDFAELLEAVVVPPEQALSFQEDKSRLTFSRVAIKQGGSGFDAVVDGDAVFRYRIDSDGIKKGIISLSRENADQWLRARQDISSFELKMFPVWNKTMPSSVNSVNVETH